jgi:protein-tyrosine phosphatase
MVKRIFLFSYLFYLTIFYSCKQDRPEIRAACELSWTGVYLIKWEIFPPMEGTVRIYESSRPDSFSVSSHVSEQDISIGYKRILSMPSFTPTYFKLIFNKKYSTITANRVIPLQEVFNFRDMGGYYSKDKRQSQWGKLYRSGSLASATLQDIYMLNQLRIKTIIDFRTEKESYRFPLKYQPSQIFNLPLRGNRSNLFFDKILSEQMKRGDVIVYQQDIFQFILENNTDYFIKMFDILLNNDNYPVVMYCSLGSDRSALAAALVLLALDMEQNTILEDYLLSNDLINFQSLVKNAELYPTQVQETITASFSAHKEVLTYSIELIKKDYGSIQNYLESELKLTAKKREKLKDLLLYKQID